MKGWHHGPLLPILLHCVDEQGRPLLGPPRTGRETEEFLRNAHADIPTVVEAMRRYWVPTRYPLALIAADVGPHTGYKRDGLGLLHRVDQLALVPGLDRVLAEIEELRLQPGPLASLSERPSAVNVPLAVDRFLISRASGFPALLTWPLNRYRNIQDFDPPRAICR